MQRTGEGKLHLDMNRKKTEWPQSSDSETKSPSQTSRRQAFFLSAGISLD